MFLFLYLLLTFNYLYLIYIFNFLFFLDINNIKYPTNNYKGLIFPNCRFSFINFLNTYYFILVNLYIRKNLKLIFSFRLII